MPQENATLTFQTSAPPMRWLGAIAGMWAAVITGCGSHRSPAGGDGPPDASSDAPAIDAAPDARTTVAITVTTQGQGSGAVTATIAGRACDAACLAAAPIGARVDFAAAASAGSWFRGWLAGCDGRHDCQVVAATDFTITAAFTAQPNRVFISSTESGGNLGGLTGGNALCQQLADRAGLGGTYRVLLSTSASDWTAQLASARGWIRVDGEPLGDRMIGDGAGLYALRLDESGHDLGIAGYWAVRESSRPTMRCSDWTTSASGSTPDVQAAAAVSTQAAMLGAPLSAVINSCDRPHHVLCAEVDRVVEVTPIATTGRLAFMTAASWNTQSGLAAADAFCDGEARQAGKPGSFKALLATSTASAISRFDTSGPPWVRPDGIPLLPSAASFKAASYLDVAPALRADGSVETNLTAIVLGAVDFRHPGTLDGTCNDWSPPRGGGSGLDPWSTVPRQLVFACDVWRLLCLQE